MSVQKIFTVPSTAEQKKIPFARVNHAKYMVTDRVVYIGTLHPLHLKWTSVLRFMQVKPSRSISQIWLVFSGTSNWSETYFTQTAGVGLVVNQTGSEVKKGQETLQSQAQELFLRDWTSDYASSLSVDDMDVCPRGPHWVVFVCQSTLHCTCALCSFLPLELSCAACNGVWMNW